MTHDYYVCLVTAPSAQEAESIARELVEKRLAACVNLVPGVRSFYRWEEKIQEDQEHLLVIKTRRECVAALEEAVSAAHSYTVPEIIALPIEAGSPAYLDWLRGSTTP